MKPWAVFTLTMSLLMALVCALYDMGAKSRFVCAVVCAYWAWLAGMECK